MINKNLTNHELLVDDAAYLMDELEALKKVITTIPYSEKPLGQDSIQEMIESIETRQREYFYPAILKIINELGVNDSDSEHFIFNNSNAADTKSSNIRDVINEIIRIRSKMINMMRECPSEVFNDSSNSGQNDKTLAALLTDMVLFDRNQFKQIAERILTIDLDRQTGKPEITNK